MRCIFLVGAGLQLDINLASLGHVQPALAFERTQGGGQSAQKGGVDAI